MKVLQINSTLNTGSTGRIAEGIGKKVIEAGGESYIAYGRSANKSKSQPIKIGNKWDQAFHLVNTRLFDTHGLHSRNATKKIISDIIIIQPDVIHLHNLHGYYLNIEILFKFLKEYKKPIVWTLHDCWPFTGHCCYYERVKCSKWQTECNHCPLMRLYPQTYLLDNSKSNYYKKKNLFQLPENIQLITVSSWLESQVKQSFLQNLNVHTIYNGVNIEIFKPVTCNYLREKHNLGSKQIILGVANVWSEGKGLNSFLELSKLISTNQIIILIGLTRSQIKRMPSNILGIERTNSPEELAEYYNFADVFVNPSIAETFGMVTAEAMACGTPSIVYDSSAMPELITDEVGFIVMPNDYQSLIHRINAILSTGKSKYSSNCTSRAKLLFEMNKQYDKYISLYKQISIT